ncbi:hypothetical protein KUV85_11180 [Nocardioides panacisoli]|uniref:hypothetical protein n=1 Tax=Nocardioides panacisoli TaxID=627624 RepID=UPI001C62CF06|nr:hypothetical protein [Nocardioides panacisoli]QYJ02897.1 hypothetical protein KUV85_11180 [Nocardioides panacisoli]
MDTQQSDLVERLRAALTHEPSTTEGEMQGGVSFLVRDEVVAVVRPRGDLLVSVDPSRFAELATRAGAAPAESDGRAMGPSWISVAEDDLGREAQLHFWVEVALEHNAHTTGS